MVFYLLPKHIRYHLNKRPDDGATTITDLPDELLLQILSDVDPLSVLRFRLSCAGAVRSCNSALQQRLKTIYIDPSMRSLQTALKICEHPMFNEEIEQVTLLGKPMWREIERVDPSYRRHLRVDLSPHSQYVTLRNSRFRVWPVEIYSGSVPGAKDIPSFDEAYGPLIEALARLPKLKRLAFAESVRDPGLNQASQSTIDAHAHKCALNPRNGQEKRLADAEVFYGLLFNSRLRFDSVRQERELPFIEHVMSKLMGENVSPDSSMNPLESVRRLEISLDCGWDHNRIAASDLYHLLVRYSSKALQQLKITLIPNLSLRLPKQSGGSTLYSKAWCFQSSEASKSSI